MRSRGQKDILLAASREQDRDAWWETLSTFTQAKALHFLQDLNWFEVSWPKVVLDTQFVANTEDQRGSVKVESVISAGEGELLNLQKGDVVIEVGADFAAHLPYDALIAKIRADDSRPLRMVLGREGDIPEGSTPVQVAASVAQLGQNSAAADAAADARVRVDSNLMISADKNAAGGESSTSTAQNEGASTAPAATGAQSEDASTPADVETKTQDTADASATGNSGGSQSGSPKAGRATPHSEVEVPGGGVTISNESHNRWVEEQNAAEYVPVLADPTEEKEGGISTKKYTAYRLTTTLGDKFWSVWRRFSDFVWLRDTLKERYVGLCIPPLPQASHTNVNTLFKNINLGNVDHAFIEIRMIGLALFIRRVLSNIFLKNDVSVQDFLKTQDRKKFDKIKGKLGLFATKKPSAASRDQRENVSLAHWKFVVAQYTAPENATRNVKDYRVQLQQLLKEYHALSKVTDSLATCVLEQYQAQHKLTTALANLCEVEENNRDPLKNEFVPQNAGGYLESMQILLTQAQHRCKVALERSPQFCLTLQAMVNYAIRETEAMIDLLKTRDDFATAASKSRQALEKIKSDISKNGSNNRRAQQLAQLEEQSATRQERAIFIDKGMLLYTIRKFQRERKEHFITAIVQWAFVMRMGQEGEQKLAATCTSKSGSNPAEAATAIKALLEQTPDIVPRELAAVALDNFQDVTELQAAVQKVGDAQETTTTTSNE